MKHVKVRISAGGREGDIHPIYGVLANAPFVRRATALQWKFTGETLGMLHYVEGDVEAFETVVTELDEAIGYDLEPAGEQAFYAYVLGSTTEPLREMFDPVADARLVIVPPIVYHEDGTVTLSLFGPDEELGTAIGRIPDRIDVTVEEVGGLASTTVAVEPILAERQREAIEAALSLGYYEIPREASHEDVAEAIDCAPSTAAEHLRKGEAKVLRNVIGT